MEHKINTKWLVSAAAVLVIGILLMLSFIKILLLCGSNYVRRIFIFFNVGRLNIAIFISFFIRQICFSMIFIRQALVVTSVYIMEKYSIRLALLLSILQSGC